jgi:hypothetical protein
MVAPINKNLVYQIEDLREGSWRLPGGMDVYLSRNPMVKGDMIVNIVSEGNTWLTLEGNAITPYDWYGWGDG